jgi:tetratricopeptide (TPR) repeat protein
MCFAACLRNSFVWDDWAYIDKALSSYRTVDAKHLYWMATTNHMGSWAPLAWLSYTLDHAIWGLNPMGYHLTNIVIHALNAVLFYHLAALLLCRIFYDKTPLAAETRLKVELGAAFAALAFALHPLRVESVVWASERRDVLSGFFFLTTLYLYVRVASMEPGSIARRRIMNCSVAAFFCATLSKATVVPLPVVLLVLDHYPLKRLGSGGNRGETRAILFEKIPYAILSVFTAAMAVHAQTASNNFIPLAAHGFWSRILQSISGLGFYAGKTLIPVGLSSLYPLPGAALEFAGPLLYSVGALTVAALLIKIACFGRQAVLALGAYYAAMLLPVLGLLQNGPQLVALRYSYLSCLGFALLAGAVVIRLMHLRAKKSPAVTALLIMAIFWLAADVGIVQRQIKLWHDDKTLWGDVFRQYPLSPCANVALALIMLHEGNNRDAEVYARTAVHVAPGEPTGLVALAASLVAQGRLAEAQAVAEQGVNLNPGRGETEGMLGFVLARLGKNEAALPHILLAARLNTHLGEAQCNAGAILARLGRFAEAIPFFENAVRLEPSNASYAAQLALARRDLPV